MCKVWNRWEGSEFSKTQPVLRTELYFPDIDNPEMILKALLHDRLEWDKSVDKNEELTEYCNGNTFVVRTVNKSVIGTAQREFIDKKIYFRASDAEEVDPMQDDIYLWVTSAPDELVPITSSYVRSDSLLGIQRMGRRKDGKPGCYLHCIVQTDVKTSAWTVKMLYPIAPTQLSQWGQTIRTYLNQKKSS